MNFRAEINIKVIADILFTMKLYCLTQKFKIMVTVIGYDKRVSEEGREFFTLSIQGGVEVVQAQSGNLYMTARKTSIPSTFDEEGCQILLGKELPGEIEKVPCDSYDYINKDTGETITLSHTYEYVEEKKQVNNQILGYNLSDTDNFSHLSLFFLHLNLTNSYCHLLLNLFQFLIC